MLEKRITSRLNASYLYMSSYDNLLTDIAGKVDYITGDMCVDMAAKLLLPMEQSWLLAPHAKEIDTETDTVPMKSGSQGSNIVSSVIELYRDYNNRTDESSDQKLRSAVEDMVLFYNEAVIKLFIAHDFNIKLYSVDADDADNGYCGNAMPLVNIYARNVEFIKQIVAGYSSHGLERAGGASTGMDVNGPSPGVANTSRGASTGMDVNGGVANTSRDASTVTREVPAETIVNNGRLFSLCRCCIEYGKGFEFFATLLQHILFGLDDSSSNNSSSTNSGCGPAITYDGCQNAVLSLLDNSSTIPYPSISVALSSLSNLELYLLIVIVRLYKTDENYSQGTVAGTSAGAMASLGNAGGSGSAAISLGDAEDIHAGLVVTWGQIYREFRQYLIQFRIKLKVLGQSGYSGGHSHSGTAAVPEKRVLQALINLCKLQIIGVTNASAATGSRSIVSGRRSMDLQSDLLSCITEQAVVYLLVPIFMLKAAFDSSDNRMQDSVWSVDSTELPDKCQTYNSRSNSVSHNNPMSSLCKSNKRVKLSISEDIKVSVLNTFSSGSAV